MDRTTTPLVDVYMPRYDVRTRYATRVNAPLSATYAALRGTDLFAPWIVWLLFALRTLPSRIGRPRARATPRTVADLERSGALLEARPGAELVLGLIGRFWALRQRAHRAVAAATFGGFAEPGFAKAVMGFAVEPIDASTTLLVTETRVQCTDDASRRRFQVYWAIIGPFSGLIRIVWLAAVKAAAERSVR